MTIKHLADGLFVSPQIGVEDLADLKARGIRSLVNNRPDGEAADQPAGEELAAAAAAHGIAYRHIPVVSGQIHDAEIHSFAVALRDMPRPMLAFCRSGTRSCSLWALANVQANDSDSLLQQASNAGYDLASLRPRLEAQRKQASAAGPACPSYDVLIVGGGAAGIAVASSLLRQRKNTSVAIIEPSDVHHYQAAFTLVGGGAFKDADTHRSEQSCIPKGAHWIRAAVTAFEPEVDRVVLEDGERVAYRTLVVCPGIKLDWGAIPGLIETLGRNSVTSNYKPGLPPYTWDLIRTTRGGEALFTQPPMPIKCAGAPQKIMYLACDHWQRSGTLANTHVQFYNAGSVLFGVNAFVPPLMNYVTRYGIDLAFNSRLVRVDGPAKRAWFEIKSADGNTDTVEKPFDMLHVTPPQRAPDFVRSSPLADAAGWVEVDRESLRHVRFERVFSLGDACSAPNAKTAAAVRKQAPVVVQNLIATLDGKSEEAVYDGYGSCPLTVERGKVVLAEFGYGGKLLPSFPFDQTKPRRSMWVLKRHILPHMYFDVLFKGREWFAKPKNTRHVQPRPIPPRATQSGPDTAGRTIVS